MSEIWTPQLAMPEGARIKLIVPRSPLIPCAAIEDLFGLFEKKERNFIGKALLKPLKDRILFMAGSTSNYASKSLGDLLWGKTAYAGETTIYAGLWAATLDDTFAGNTASECGYTSYARHSMTNNTTIFAAGSGTTTYTKTFPSDAAHSWATSTGTGSNNTVTYLGFLNGNAGTSADKGLAWCSITSTTINNGDTPQLAQNAVSWVQD